MISPSALFARSAGVSFAQRRWSRVTLRPSEPSALRVDVCSRRPGTGVARMSTSLTPSSSRRTQTEPSSLMSTDAASSRTNVSPLGR